MSITRRKFLKAGTLVALSAAIPLKAAAQQPRKVNDGNSYRSIKGRRPRPALDLYQVDLFIIFEFHLPALHRILHYRCRTGRG